MDIYGREMGAARVARPCLPACALRTPPKEIARPPEPQLVTGWAQVCGNRTVSLFVGQPGRQK